jgi:hypothetical protein
VKWIPDQIKRVNLCFLFPNFLNAEAPSAEMHPKGRIATFLSATPHDVLPVSPVPEAAQ